MTKEQAEWRKSQALAMIDAFISAGAERFDLSTVGPNKQLVIHVENLDPDKVSERIHKSLRYAVGHGCDLIIRPRSLAVTLVQLDDLDTK
jgi:hypothetical protein